MRQIVDKQLSSPLIKYRHQKVSHFTLIPLDNYKNEKKPSVISRRFFLAFFIRLFSFLPAMYTDLRIPAVGPSHSEVHGGLRHRI